MQETPPLPPEPEKPEPVAEPAAPAPAAETPATEAASPDAPAAPATPAAPAVPEMSPAACAAALAERFPALFAVQPPLPIKLRIQADIQERAPGVFTRKAMSLFLHRHTTSTPYIRALVAAQTRFDLDGQPAGEIAAEHREAAVAELERRKAIVQARRQAERAAMKPPQGERPLRPPRPPRPDQPPGAPGAARPERPPREGVPRDGPPREGRPGQPPRPPRHQRPNAPQRPPQQGRPPRPEHDRPHAEQRRPPPPPREAEPALPPGPDAEARRSRALLLRAYETSTISRANFCALKGLTDAALEAQLQQARAERGEHAAPRAADRPRR